MQSAFYKTSILQWDRDDFPGGGQAQRDQECQVRGRQGGRAVCQVAGGGPETGRGHRGPTAQGPGGITDRGHRQDGTAEGHLRVLQPSDVGAGY